MKRARQPNREKVLTDSTIDPVQPRPRRGRKPAFRSGFVSVLGRPNAGKSTLVNAFAGVKLAIVSAKPQTTRNALQAIVNRPNAQMIFVDTPGIHEATTKTTLLHARMMEHVRASAAGQDVLLWLADATVPFEESSRGMEILKGQEAPVLLVANKVDNLRDKRMLLPLFEQYGKLQEFAEYLPVSALKGEGLEALERAIVARLPRGPMLFPEDQLTDAPERFLASELIREKILEATGQEVPHAAAIQIETWEESPKLLKIGAAINVERDGQKRIVIGAKGAMLRQIGAATRAELEERYGKKVFLELFVKVRPKWRESPSFLAELEWKA